MEFAVIFILALIEAGVFVGLMYQAVAKRKHDFRKVIDTLSLEVAERKALVEKVTNILNQMVDIEEVRKKASEMRQLREGLKAERGRVTITQAELETVEGRLRELEEIERELEASGLETKEELGILKKKEKELSNKNDQLKTQISSSMEQIDELLQEITVSVEMEDQVVTMKTELVQAQNKVDLLLLQIEQGNEQYFVIKRRYDALDIEYAQLFEKFSEVEAMAGKSQ